MSTVLKPIWTIYAELVSTKGDKKWRVQINEHGQLRCNCPAYIFSKDRPKSCKHCRRCEEERALELQAAVNAQPAPIQISNLESELPLPPKPGRARQRVVAPEVAKQAVDILDAVLIAGHLHISSFVQRAAMVDALAMKLASFIPVQATVEVVEVGIRRITFDD